MTGSLVTYSNLRGVREPSNVRSRYEASSRAARASRSARDDRRPRPRAGRGRGAGPGVRGLPHRPALPRGRHQRRLPVPARPRGGRRRGVGRRRASPTSRPATSSSSTGGRCAASAGPACAAGPGTASTPTTPSQKMTLDRRHRALPGPGHRRLRREDPGRAPGQCTKVDPAASRPPPGLLGCGVMAGHRRRDQHRQRRPRRLRRRHRLRRRRRRGDRRAPGWPARRRSSPSTSTTASWRRPQQFGATHTVNSRDDRPGRGDPRADRRLRRRRRHRRGRPPGDLPAGLLRPRPGRHGRPGRRAHPGHEARTAAARRLRPRRRAQVVLVRRLPALPRLPDADRPVPAGPARPGRVRHRDHRPRRRRGGLRPDARGRRAALGGGAADGRRASSTWSPPAPSRLDGGTWDVDNNVWIVGDDDEASSSTPPTTPTPIVGRRRRPHAAAPSSAPTATTTTSTRPPRWPTATGAPILLHPDDRLLWKQTHPDRHPDGELADGQVLTVGRYGADGAAHPGPRPRRGLPATRPSWAPSSPATPCSRAAPAPPAGPSRTSRRSSTRSGTGCSPCRRETVVRTGHGDATTIGAEAPHLEEWIARGH